jgi:hypothetical protein
MAISTAIMAITTRSSINVNAFLIMIVLIFLILGLQHNYKAFGSGAQTNPPGPGSAGEILIGRLILTGLLF